MAVGANKVRTVLTFEKADFEEIKAIAKRNGIPFSVLVSCLVKGVIRESRKKNFRMVLTSGEIVLS